MAFWRRPVRFAAAPRTFSAGMQCFSTTARGLTNSSPTGVRKKRVTKPRETSDKASQAITLVSSARDSSLPLNPFSIQILPSTVQRQLFGANAGVTIPEDSVQKCYDHLKKHNLYDKFGEIKQVDLPEPLALPPLLPAGDYETPAAQQVDENATNVIANIDMHFRRVAETINRPYHEVLNKLLTAVADGSLPRMPSKWQTCSGWVRYDADGSWCKVASPDEKCLVFDVETAMQEPNQPPTLATAVSSTHWYSWCSAALANRLEVGSFERDDDFHENAKSLDGPDSLRLSDLIPLESGNAGDNEPRLVIGHNVAFDRSYIREQYRVQPVSRMRFLDTMSLHIALAGFANPQRAAFMGSYKTSAAKESAAATAKKAAAAAPEKTTKKSTGTKAAAAEKAAKPAKDLDKAAEAQRKYFALRAKKNQHHTWPMVGSLSNLSDVYDLHCRQNLANTGLSTIKAASSAHAGPNSRTLSFKSNSRTDDVIIPPGLDKQLRDMFVTGSLDDIAEQYQPLCTYCAKDVLATLEVLCRLWPQFQHAFPHPVTTAGMLEMSTTFLPVNINNWHRYIALSDCAFGEAELQVQRVLNEAATHAVLTYAAKNSTLSPHDDMWLWDLDWTPATISLVSTTKVGALQVPAALLEALPIDYKKGGQITVPTWYKKLLKESNVRDTKKSAGRAPDPAVGEDADFMLNLTSRMRIVPKLLKLTWDGWPLHHDIKKGWGYLQPDDAKTPLSRKKVAADAEQLQPTKTEPQFPLKMLLMHEKAMLKASAADEADAIDDAVDTSAAKKKKNASATAMKKVAANERKQVSLDEKLQSYDSANDAERVAIIEAVVAAANKPPPLQTIADDAEISEHQFESAGESGGGTAKKGNPHRDVVPGCVFRRLTHSDGSFGNVGNPLAQEFLEHFQSGRLRSTATSPQLRNAVDSIVRLSKRMAQWLMYKKRVNAQILVETDDLGSEESDHETKWGVILPRVVPMGTVTRRAVEPTWLTALNPKPDRIASELKALVQAPKNYAFVGADVDSQELWIAALYGDARFAGQHGCTALGWMTLQGTKAEGTDMHSRVAQLVGCDRDQAKVLNYARIYGAGQAYVAQMLKKFQPELTKAQASARAFKLMRSTKGEKVFKLNSFGQTIMKQARKLQAEEEAKFLPADFKVAESKTEEETISGTATKKPRRKTASTKSSLPEAADGKQQWFTQGELQHARAVVESHARGSKKSTKSAASAKKSTGFVKFDPDAPRRTYMDMVSDWAWRGGSESAMFNALESIAKSDEPRTPVLQSAVTRCLQKRHVGDDFFTSRVNWVVQSSAVDYLHLMLVSMRYLCEVAGINSARLALSIHDEVRFLVRDEDKYKAALALQYTNLLTRAMFAHRLGINNLPASVAFFSSVEIDRCIRKQANDNCITPSNVRGMHIEYGIPPGESLTIQELVQKLESTGEGTRFFTLTNDNVTNDRQVERVSQRRIAVAAGK